MTSIISPLLGISRSSNPPVGLPGKDIPIPVHRIDLSLPPSQHYVALATEFAPQIRALTPLFDDTIHPLVPSKWLQALVKFLAWLFLRNLYSAEQTEELRGMAYAIGVDLWLLVALNVLLDCMLGCTSGAVMTMPRARDKRRKRVADDGNEDGRVRMMHFRTLDWGMDPLRSILVQLEFVRSKSAEPERVVARTITYVGFVGVLTGVREGLSVSLNFRPNHVCGTRELKWHQMKVLLGYQPSIASVLRDVLFNDNGEGVTHAPSLDTISRSLSARRSAPCYIILCDGTLATVLEKDLATATSRTSREFIVHTNHDASTQPYTALSENSEVLGDFLQDSRERSACLQKKWNDLKGRQRRKQLSEGREEGCLEWERLSVREETLVAWVRRYPTINEQSHFGCVMDAGKGKVRWIERGEIEEEEA